MTAASYARIPGANDRITLGFIGTGERGKFMLEKFLAQADVQVAAVCDVFDERTAEARKRVPAAQA